jgi:hypothetical protein
MKWNIATNIIEHSSMLETQFGICLGVAVLENPSNFYFNTARTLLVKKHEARDPAEKERRASGQFFCWGTMP